METKTPTLSYDMYIAAPAEKVWKSLTAGAVTQQYFYGTKVTGDFEKGALLRYVADGDHEMMRAKVLEVAPDKRLVTTCEAVWDDAVKGDAPSRLTWELT